jgi:AmmeMemoRadiSam system protein B
MDMMNPINTRPAALAGTWYSANPQQLHLDVETYLQHAAPPEIPGEIVALFAPHAGHHYSGPVAGYAFRTIQGNSYETIAVVSPYHRGYPERLLTTSHERYSTPLGEVPVDTDSLFKLKEQLQETAREELALVRQDREHAIEIELPFLQVAVAGKFELLPVMVSDSLPETGIALGKALAAVLKGKKALLIASTDLSHFYPEAAANQLDLAMLDAIGSFDTEEVIEVHRSGKGQACGFLPVLAVMTAAKALGATQAHILHYATSGSTSGDYSRVVGYAAGVFTR